VYLQAATSFGKSICFQLPAIVDHGSESNCPHHLQDELLLTDTVTIVISPLLALMVRLVSKPVAAQLFANTVSAIKSKHSEMQVSRLIHSTAQSKEIRRPSFSMTCDAAILRSDYSMSHRNIALAITSEKYYIGPTNRASWPG